MKLHCVRLCGIFSVFQLLAFCGTALAATNIEFVVDLSGSMRQKLGGETQFESARKALSNALAHVQPGTLVAVRVYGHRVEQTDKANSCKDTELLVPFGPANSSAIGAKVGALTPKGYTPIAYSLEQTRNDLYDVAITNEAERVIILLTDGEETCGGDPVAVLKKLKSEGFKLTVYTVGFNVNDVARDQLKAIAAEGGGKYFDAKNGAELSTALEQATTEVAVISKTTKLIGTPIRGGDNQSDPVPIEYDKEYRLDHHQKRQQYDYFSFEVQSGEQITLTLNTLEKGVTIGESTAVENDNPYASASIIDPQRNALKTVDIIGTRDKVETYTFRPASAGRYLLSVGSVYADMNKDQCIFKLTKESKGDADTDKDAGADPAGALPIEAKRYQHNSIGGGDKVDTYSFDAKSGEQYFVGIIPAGSYSGWFSLKVYDEYRQILLEAAISQG